MTQAEIEQLQTELDMARAANEQLEASIMNIACYMVTLADVVSKAALRPKL